LRGHGIDLPVLAVFAPFGDPRVVTGLIHEVPGTASPSRPDARRGPAGDERADPVSATMRDVGRLRGLASGVLIHAPGGPDDRMTGLVAELATVRRAS
jgi:hypothetical protein